MTSGSFGGGGRRATMPENLSDERQKELDKSRQSMASEFIKNRHQQVAQQYKWYMVLGIISLILGIVLTAISVSYVISSGSGIYFIATGLIGVGLGFSIKGFLGWRSHKS
jgi:hypothetical protein